MRPSRLVLIGIPKHRRLTLFQEALASAGLPAAFEISWLDIARGARPLDSLDPGTPTVIRIDSFGESPEVERAFLALGYESALTAGVDALAPDAVDAIGAERGRILAPRQHHLGFLAALARIEEALRERPCWRALSAPRDIRILFDKRATSQLYASLGVPVPNAVTAATSCEELRSAMRTRGLGSVFVKLSCGSSGAGVAIYSRGTRDVVLSTIETGPNGWFNTRRLRRYVRPREIDEVLGFLLREGAQIEEHVPKARLDGQPFDCRILLIAGEPAFVVARRSPHPITNLHLGAKRADLDRLAQILPLELYEAALASCARIHGAHECFHLGIDVLFEEGFGGHRILEANAFGDYLPKLRRDGRTVYDWQVERLRALLDGGAPTIGK